MLHHRFTSLGDTHGHEAGDAWLRTFAAEIQGRLRLDDPFRCYGGGDFVVLLPQTGIGAAVQAATASK